MAIGFERKENEDNGHVHIEDRDGNEITVRLSEDNPTADIKRACALACRMVAKQKDKP